MHPKVACEPMSLQAPVSMEHHSKAEPLFKEDLGFIRHQSKTISLGDGWVTHVGLRYSRPSSHAIGHDILVEGRFQR